MGRQGLIILDISNPANLRRVGGCDTPGMAKDIVAKGNVLYVADGWLSREEEDPRAGLLVIDAEDETNPRIVRNVSSLDARGLLLGGDFLYVVAGGKLHVFDVTQPLAPWALGDCEINGPTGFWRNPKLALQGNILCIANNLAGLEVVDVSNPGAPRRLSTFDTPMEARAVVLNGSYAYIADNEGGILILDLAIPEIPERVGHLPLSGWPVSLELQDEFLIAGDSALGLRVFDLQNPAAPRLRSEIKTPFPTGLLSIHSRLYSAEDGSGFNIYDLSALPALTRLGEFQMTGYTSDVKIRGDHAFLAESFRLEILDVTDPRHIRSIGEWRAPSPVMAIDVQGEYAFLGGGDGISVVNIARVDAPAFVSEASVGGSVWELHAAVSFLLVEKGHPSPSLVAAFDISNPADLRRLDWSALSGFDRIVAVADRYAYLSSSQANKLAVLDLQSIPPAIVGVYEEPGTPNSPWRGVRHRDFLYVNERAFDVSDPTNPRLVGRFPSSPWQIVADGDFIYGAASQFVNKYDLAEPALPRLVGVSQRSTYELFNRLAVRGDTVFAVSPQGLHALDMTRPANPQRVATRRPSADSTTRGNTAYVADGALTVFDISDRSQPLELARTGSSLWSLAIADSIVYAAGYIQGIKVIDVGVPSSPLILKTLRPGGTFNDLVVSGDRLYAGSEILRVFDISKPSDPVERGAFQTQTISELVVSENKAYIVSDPGRFEILDVSNPSVIRLLSRFGGGGFGGDGYFGSPAISGNHLFLTHHEYHSRAAIVTFDVSDPTHPIEIGRMPIFSSAHLEIDGNILYSAGDGLEVYDVSDAANLRLLGRNGAVPARHIHCAGDWLYLSSHNGWHILHSFAAGISDPLRFENPSTFTPRLVGIPGLDVRVENSSDLINWQNLASFKLPRHGQDVNVPFNPTANTFLRARVR